MHWLGWVIIGFAVFQFLIHLPDLGAGYDDEENEDEEND